MEIASVGAPLFEILLNDEIKEIINYHHIATENHEAGVYKSIFDGATYRNIYLNKKISEILGNLTSINLSFDNLTFFL